MEGSQAVRSSVEFDLNECFRLISESEQFHHLLRAHVVVYSCGDDFDVDDFLNLLDRVKSHSVLMRRLVFPDG